MQPKGSPFCTTKLKIKARDINYKKSEIVTKRWFVTIIYPLLYNFIRHNKTYSFIMYIHFVQLSNRVNANYTLTFCLGHPVPRGTPFSERVTCSLTKLFLCCGQRLLSVKKFLSLDSTIPTVGSSISAILLLKLFYVKFHTKMGICHSIACGKIYAVLIQNLF